MTNACYTPTSFQPQKTPLLSLGQWQVLQLYLADAQNLNAAGTGVTDPSVLAIYGRLRTQAITFSGTVLPEAQLLGNQLYHYGSTSNLSFGGIANLMTSTSPDKTAITELLGNLKQKAQTYQAQSETVYQGISDFITESQQDVTDLKTAAQAELAKAASDHAQIVQMHLTYESKFADMQMAQAAIVGDNKAINSTKYYSWVPFVGTAVAVGEIVAHENDIKKQLARIAADVADMQSLTQQMNALKADISQLTYTAKYNTKMADQIQSALGSLNLIKGAWKTIVSELGDVIGNIADATSQELKNNTCLSAVSLGTAATEWGQVANDASSFAMNFYVQPKAA